MKRQIDFENKEYKKVFDSITKTEHCFEDKWAKKLEPFFPYELINIYKKKIKQNIKYKKVHAYNAAINYCFRVKNIQVVILNKKEEWEPYFKSLKENYPKLPALQRELRKLEDWLEVLLKMQDVLYRKVNYILMHRVESMMETKED